MKFLLVCIAMIAVAAGKESEKLESFPGIPLPNLCRPRVLHGFEGNLSSPNYPRNYYNNMRCVWRITVPRGKQVELRFLDFLLEAHSQCKYDYVEVRSGSTLLGKFCGTTKPSPMIATSGSMTVTFVTDRTITKRGFWSIYKAISPDIAKCPGSVPMLPQAGLTRGPSTIVGFVSSPHYPSNYGNNQLCVWKLHVPSGHSVKLTFLDFKIEGSTNCRFDYVEMRNGSTASSPPLGKFCGYRKPPVIIAGSGSMYITFKSDGSVVKKGFRAKYEPTY